MGVDALITALADKIREKFGVTGPLSFAKMTEELDAVKLGSDVSGVTITASEGLSPRKFVDANGQLVECTMVNHGAVDITLSALEKEYGVPAGYHNGNGKVRVLTESKTVVPSAAEQIVTPSDGKLLSQVAVSAIPNAVTPCTLTVINNGSSAAIVVYNRYDRGTSVPVRQSVGAGQTVALDVASGAYVHVYPGLNWFMSVEHTNISHVYTSRYYFEHPNGNTSDIYFAAYFQMNNSECSITVS